MVADARSTGRYYRERCCRLPDRNGFGRRRCFPAAPGGTTHIAVAAGSGRANVCGTRGDSRNTGGDGEISAVCGAGSATKHLAWPATSDEGGGMKCEEAAEFGSALWDGERV